MAKVFVNCDPIETKEAYLSYADVVNLAGYPEGAKPTVIFFGRIEIEGEKYTKSGTLFPGGAPARVWDGMHFSAMFTENT